MKQLALGILALSILIIPYQVWSETENGKNIAQTTQSLQHKNHKIREIAAETLFEISRPFQTFIKENSPEIYERSLEDLLQNFTPNIREAVTALVKSDSQISKYVYIFQAYIWPRVHPRKPQNYTGLWVGWYENGLKMLEFRYQNGQLSGERRAWHDNGQISWEASFPNGEELFTQWYRNGQQQELRDKHAGKDMMWDIHGNLISVSYVKQGIVQRVENYEKGELVRIKFQDGRIENYKNGQLVTPITLPAKDDPSSKPIVEEGQIYERFRILGDFNNDGIEDMALSNVISSFGNAGGNFEIYLRDQQGNFILHGSMFCHPLAIAVENSPKNPRIWAYLRSGGGSGRIGYYEVKKQGLTQFQGITIYPGDGGTEISNHTYRVLGKTDSKLTIEKSTTTNGKVQWKPGYY